MQAEFEAAVEDGEPFVFAIGCLIAAWREMVKQSEGRLVLANYALALGLLLPMAAAQFEQATGSYIFSGGSLVGNMQGASTDQNPYLIWTHNSAEPVLLTLRLLLGMAHLCLAWALVEGDWPRVVKFVALIGAATMALVLFASVLMLDLSPLILHLGGLAIGLAAICATARWHARLFSPTSPELPAR